MLQQNPEIPKSNKSKFRQMMKYETYKPSGIEWIGDIPEHWEVTRIKDLFSILSGNGFPDNQQGLENGDYPFLKVSDINSDEKKVSLSSNYVDEETVLQHGWNIIPANSILTGKIGEALKKNHRKINQVPCLIDNNMMALHPSGQINIEFSYFLLSVIDMDWFTNPGTIPSVSPQALKSSKVSLPPLPEQASISAYLDSQTQNIDQLIANKKAQVERLKELRQIEINNAVTKGLNPHAPMKDSGVEWLGEIPEHWEVKRLKNIAEVVLGKMLQNDDTGSDNLKPYLRSFNVQWERTDLSDVKEMWLSENEMQQYRLKKFDIVVSEGGEVGRAALWLDEIEECYIQNSVHKVTCRKKVNPYYLLYQFSMLGKAGFFETIINKVSIGHLTREKLVACHFLVPPIAEQLQIAEHLQQRTAAIDKLIKNTVSQIEKLQELRKIKIYEAVTGKVKCHA